MDKLWLFFCSGHVAEYGSSKLRKNLVCSKILPGARDDTSISFLLSLRMPKQTVFFQLKAGLRDLIRDLISCLTGPGTFMKPAVLKI